MGEAGHLVSPGQARGDVHVDDIRPAGEFRERKVAQTSRTTVLASSKLWQ